MSDDTKKVVDRPDWRPRRERGAGKSRARACNIGELPENVELRARVLATALAILEDSDANANARVGAGKLLLEATEPDLAAMMVRILGDEQRFESWLETELARIREKRAMRALPEGT